MATHRQSLVNSKSCSRPFLAIERLNGRVKAFRKLNHVRVRGRFKVRVHVMLSAIVLQARALAFPAQMRECVRPVA